MKAITVHYVLHRPGAEVEYARQREMIGDLVTALSQTDGQALEPWLAEDFARATSDAERLRVIIDQVASLTDVSIVDWTRRLVRPGPTVILGDPAMPSDASS
jgi:dGTPase